MRRPSFADHASPENAYQVPAIMKAERTLMVNALPPPGDVSCAKVNAHPRVAQKIEPVPLLGE